MSKHWHGVFIGILFAGYTLFIFWIGGIDFNERSLLTAGALVVATVMAVCGYALIMENTE